MTRTHHATRTWRLSCGCLRDYPGMPLGKAQSVLCVSCGTAVMTEYAYPDQCCGHRMSLRTEDGTLHVCCTRKPGNSQCTAGVHYDANVKQRFRARGSLRAANEGRTDRA